MAGNEPEHPDLGGLAIAVGRVVDDSIVVMENVYRHIQLGEDRRTAALNATREVAMPITASTMTTIAVFAPLALVGGFIGIIFVPFALTITFALVASLLPAELRQHRPQCKRHRARRAGQRAGARELGEFETVLTGMKANGTVEVYQSSHVSSAQFGVSGTRSDSATVLVTLAEGVDADLTADEFANRLAGPGRTITVSKTEAAGFGGNMLEPTLLGEDYSKMAEAADTLTAEISKLEGVENVGHDGASAAGFAGTAPIKRVDGRRAITISGTITASNPQALQGKVKEVTDRAGLPAGVELATGGVFEDINEAFARMGIAMLAGIALVYIIMVVTQRLFVAPFVIIMTLPLAAIGAIGGLFVTQRALGLPALMGILMLIGLVVTNAIVLIAFVEDLRKRGESMHDALIKCGKTRMRPILMTALTTIFVLLPLALGLTGGGSGIIGAELATVVIGGLMTSTFLTLVVIPVIYSLLRRKRPEGQCDKRRLDS